MKTANSSSFARPVRAAFIVALGILPAVFANGARAQGGIVPPPMAPMAIPMPEPARPTADMNKNVAEMEDKVSENARTAVKRLDNSADPMTLEDLNNARQTVARIEALIDVERRMIELDKLRNERGSRSSSLAAAIPASALAPLPNQIAAPVERPRPTMFGGEIQRISGTEGKYTAVLKFTDGEVRPVKVGDQLSGSAAVRWISSSAVGIEENGSTHTLHIKNVSAIYSAMR